MKARLMLAALAWNHRSDPGVEKVAASEVVWSKRRKSWVLRTRSKLTSWKMDTTPTHIPMLMRRVLHVHKEKIDLPPI